MNYDKISSVKRWGSFLYLLASLYASAESIYHVNPLVSGSVTLAGTAATIIPYAFASKWIRLRCPCDPHEVNGFDRGAIGNSSSTAATLSDGLLGAAILLPVLMDWRVLGPGKELFEDYAVYAETLAVSSGLVSIIKVAVERPIPRSYSGDPEATQNFDGYRSFYSGHATLAVSALSAASFTIGRRYGSSAWPWIVTGGVGVAISAARVAAGNHFYTDVIVGMGVGAMIGTAIPWLHAVSGGEIALLPNAGGFQIAWGKSL